MTGNWTVPLVGTVANALVVPVPALRAQTGGGYAVEVVGGDARSGVQELRLAHAEII